MNRTIFKGRSMPTLILIAMTGTSLAVLVSLGLAWIMGMYRDYGLQSERVTSHYVIDQKVQIKTYVESAITHIRFCKRNAEGRLKKTVMGRTGEAVAIAGAIYENNKNRMPPEQIQKMIIETLRSIRFNDGRGYYFITRLDGVEMLFADRPEVEGKNLIDLKSEDGKYVIRDMIDLVKTRHEGFYEYFWTKPSAKGGGHGKIAYVKLFEPYGWLIGTGEYLEDVEADIKKEVLDWLVQFRYGTSGYLFGSFVDGNSLFTNGKITIGESNISDLTDPDGVRIFQEHLRAVANPEGGFVNYSWKKLDSEKPSPKVAFVKLFPDWNWIIGTGVYIDEVENELSDLKNNLYSELRYTLVRIVIIMILTLFLILFITMKFSNYLRKEIGVFFSFFNRVKDTGELIDQDELGLEEFRRLSLAANEMSVKRTEALKALSKSEERYRFIVETAREGVMILDNNKIITYLNMVMSEMLGYPPEEIFGRDMQEFMFPEDIPDHKEKMRHREMGMDETYERRFRRRDGSELWTLVSARSLKDESGRYSGSFAMFTDITKLIRVQNDLKKAKLEAEAASRAKSEFLAIMSHEIRTPLNGLMGMLHLTKITELNDEQQEYINIALQSSRNLMQILSDILDISRIEAGSMTIVEHEFALESVVSPVLQLFRDEAVRKGLKLHSEIFPATPVHLVGDAGRIRQVIFNLVGNAIKYTESGEVKIEVYSLPYQRRMDTVNVHFVVRDTGIGIEDDKIDLVFGVFTQVESDSTRRFGGVGLGLAIVKRLINLMHGTLAIMTDFGKGTEIHLTIPLRPIDRKEDFSGDAGWKDENQPAGLIGTSLGRILVVEDERVNRMAIVRILNKIGYETFEAENGLLALEKLRKEKVDLVMMDIQMPFMDGMEATRRIRGSKAEDMNPDVPVIALTAHAMSGDREYFLQAGMNDYIAKPIEINDLKAILAKYVGYPGA